MGSQLRIHLLGTPQLLRGDLCLRDFPTEKVKLTLAYLILFRQTAHARQVLAGLLWGDYPEARARHSLSTTLWRLRHWLEPLQLGGESYLLIEDGHIAFNHLSRYWLDVAEFEERIQWARQNCASAPDEAAAALARAVELYKGELLEGCYADWCLAERDRLHQLYLDALLRLMLYYGGRKEYSRGIEFGQRILAYDPLREDVHREVMKFLASNGQPAEALAQYRHCQAALREELFIEPTSETQAVFHKIRKTTTPSTSATPSAPENLHELGSQLEHLLEKMDRLLKSYDAARAEIGQVMEAIRHLQHNTAGGHKPEQTM